MCVTGDGHPDLLWEHSDGTLMAWPMEGVTRLPSGSQSFSPTTTGSGWDVLGIGDFTDDGYQDLLLQHTDGPIRVWKLIDFARQGEPLALSQGLTDPAWLVKGAGDVNGDGHPDVVFHHPANGDVVVWLLNGLTVTASLGVANPGDLNWQIAAVADLNADGNHDLVWQHQTQGWLAAWYLNGGALLESVNLNPA